MQPTPSDHVYVTELPVPFDEDQCRAVFGAYGTVLECRVLPATTPDQQRVSALIRFQDMEQAQWVVENVDGNIPTGLWSVVKVRFANQPDEGNGNFPIRLDPSPGAADGGTCAGRTSTSIKQVIDGLQQSCALPGGKSHAQAWPCFIGGLPPDCTNHDLYEVFSNFGAIATKGVNAMKNPDGTCKGVGFVNFLDEESAELAVQTLDAAVMPDGYTWRVEKKIKVAKEFEAPQPRKSGRNFVPTMSTGQEVTGIIKSYNTASGFGFIASPGVIGDVFFMRTSLPPEAQFLATLQGQAVRFELTTTAEGKLRAGQMMLT